MKIATCFLVLAVVAIAAAAPINQSLAMTLATKGVANIIIKMAAQTGPVLKSLNAPLITDRATRLNTVVSALKAHAAESQKNVIAALAGVEHHVLWITNEVAVPAANAALVEKLAALEGIAEIHEEYIMELVQPVHIKDVLNSGIFAEQGIELIQAHEVWAQGNTGVGAVLSSIDTGVRGTHEALIASMNPDYFWYDPSLSTPFPEDGNGHGTATMGTIAGSQGIGVAPGAKWMACRGCATNSCSQSDLTRCAQFIACPTRPDGSDSDCSKAPHVVTNAWVPPQGSNWYDMIIEAWHSAGIIPIFANGNSGPSCGSATFDPLSVVISVGASTLTDGLATFSSVGPTPGGGIKPDIVAPGQGIRSASHGADDTYINFSSSAIAASHVAGVIGLMASKNPNLTYVQVVQALKQTDRNLQPTGRNCGGIPETTFPNNAFGWGRVNAFNSVAAMPSQSHKRHKLKTSCIDFNFFVFGRK